MNRAITTQQLQAQAINSDNFRPYGQLILPTTDGKPFDRDDAQLDLNQGTPRFYIMQLQHRGRHFRRITRHQRCTQCLGSLDGKDWYIAVAPPDLSQTQPDLEALAAFHLDGSCAIKLEVGTWHAGPYFDHELVNFYNLELSDTNLSDHFTYDYGDRHNLEFEIV
jgi:ureidoglycolate hydrolase